MKLIPLTQGKFAQVDDEDYDFLMQWKWHVQKSRNTFYAVRGGGILMHRVIMSADNFKLIDHKDRDGLNCQKTNLRHCTLSQNQANRFSHGSSKYLGVLIRNEKYYISQITKNGKGIYIGCFKNEIDAAISYDKKAKEVHGEFARLNFPDEQ
jgi:hypothetical protein